MPSDPVLVVNWETINNADELSDREKDVVANIINETSWDFGVWILEWILEDSDRDIEVYESTSQVAVGDIADYSEKAWQFWQPYRNQTQDTTGFSPRNPKLLCSSSCMTGQ